MKTPTMILVAVLIAAPVHPKEKKRPFQNYPLTDQMIAKAIGEGQEGKGRMTGLSLKDSLSRFARNTGNKTISTGFSVEIYTPYSWVSQQASWAAKRYMPFNVEDVTDDMRVAVLRVYANPDMPTKVTAEGMKGTSGVDHIIIRSTAKKGFEVLQPVTIEEDWDYAYNAFGAEIPYASKTAVFELQQVAEICKLDKKGEFFVVVIGTTVEEKKFKVKTKHFDRLL